MTLSQEMRWAYSVMAPSTTRAIGRLGALIDQSNICEMARSSLQRILHYISTITLVLFIIAGGENNHIVSVLVGGEQASKHESIKQIIQSHWLQNLINRALHGTHDKH